MGFAEFTITIGCQTASVRFNAHHSIRGSLMGDPLSLRRWFRFGMVQKISSALIGKIPQTDAAAAWSTEFPSLRVRREALLKVFKGIELARVGLHVGRDERVILLRDRAQLVPIEPFFSNVADVTQIARAQ